MAIEIVDVVVVEELDNELTRIELRDKAELEAAAHGITMTSSEPEFSRNPVVVDGELIDPMVTNKAVYIYKGTVEV